MGSILLCAFFNMSASNGFSHLCRSVPLNAIGVMKVVLDIFVVIEDTCVLGTACSQAYWPKSSSYKAKK